MAVVFIEGKPITLGNEIVEAGKEAIRDALWIDFPDLELDDIEIQRSAAPGAPLEATVVKRGQGKGQVSEDHLTLAQRDVLAVLNAAPGYLNPAILLAGEVLEAERTGDKDFMKRIVRDGRLDRAMEAGEREGKAVSAALHSLTTAKAVPSVRAPQETAQDTSPSDALRS